MNIIAIALSAASLYAPLITATPKSKASLALTLGKSRTVYTGSVANVVTSPTGDRVAVSYQSSPSVDIYNVLTGAKMREFLGHKQPALALAWSPDGQKIASGDERAQIYVWNADTGHAYIGYRTHTRGIQSLSFSPSSTLIVSTGEDDLMTIYDLHKPKPVVKVYGHGANLFGAHFAPNSNVIVTGTLTPSMRLYTDTGYMARKFTERDGLGDLDAEFNPSGSEVVMAGRDGKATVFNEKTGQKIGTMTDGTNYLKAAIYSPDGRVIAVSSNDGNVKLFDSHSFKLLATMDGTSTFGSPLAFTADGKYLISTDSFDRLTITPISPALGPSHVIRPILGSSHHRRHRK